VFMSNQNELDGMGSTFSIVIMAVSPLNMRHNLIQDVIVKLAPLGRIGT
jgi:hypothetical protein